MGVEEEQLTEAGLTNLCEKFLTTYKNQKDVKVYFERINRMMTKQHPVLNIDYMDIEHSINFQGNIAFISILNEFTKNPRALINAFQSAVESIMRDIHPDYAIQNAGKFSVRIRNYSNEMEIPEVRSSDAGKLASLKGIISMLEQPSTLILRPKYICQECWTVMEGQESRDLQYREVRRCIKCSSPRVELDLENSEKTTYQRINLQQLHERVEPGSMAADVECWIMGDDLINTINPGERVKIIGYIRLKQKKPLLNAWYEFYIEVNNISSMHDDAILEEDVSEDEVKKAIDPVDEEKSFDKLVRSICPTLKGMDDIKTACLLQLVTSEAVMMPDESRVRGDINILLIGDSGTGKSTLMKFCAKCLKRANYSAGKGNTKAGLTATVVREGTSLARLEAGLYLTCDNGLAVVDEIDKADKDDLKALPYLMDDLQVLPIHKAGINKEIPCRAASLHGCNPLNGKWVEENTLVENVDFPHWLLDRYDLKFVLKNKAEEQRDRDTSTHYGKMLQLAVSERDVERKKKEASQSLPSDYYKLKFIKSWVAYCRKHYDPVVPPRIIGQIQEFYMHMRGKDVTKDITMREMGILYRLSRASARAHMRNEVIDKDVELGKYLILQSLMSCGFNPDTGQIDYGMTQGTSESPSKASTTAFRRCINTLTEDFDGRADKKDILEFMKAAGIKESVTKTIIDRAHKAGYLYEAGNNIYRKTPDWEQF